MNETLAKRHRKQPQPRNFKEFAIIFSDGTIIKADPTDIVEKTQQAQAELLKPENAGKLTLEIRGLSLKITSIHQKSSRTKNVQLDGEGVHTDDNRDDGAIVITYQD